MLGRKVGKERGVGEGMGKVAGRVSCEGKCFGGGGKNFFLVVNEGRWGCNGNEKEIGRAHV